MKKLFCLTAIALGCVIAMSPTAQATNVTFNVNMSVQIALGNFVVGTNQVVVRGTLNNWSGNDNACVDQGGGVYSGTWDITEGALEYKFVIIGGASDVWESVNNRTATVGTEPLNLAVVYFNDITSADNADVEVLFRVDMRVQILNGGFDPNTDWIVVRGNHTNIGNWGGATRLDLEPQNEGVYSQRIQFENLPTNVALEYKFVILDAGDPNAANWESTPNRSFTPTGDEPDNLPPPGGNGFGEINPALVFFSDVSFDDIIAADLWVIFQVEDTPLRGKLADVGYVVDVQTGTDTVRQINEIDAAGFFNLWPWGSFAAEHVLNDDGQDGDLTADDHVWSKRILFPAGSPRTLIYKYGVNALDAEAGFARNHEQILDETGGEFRMSIDCWGSPDTLFANWACIISAVDDEFRGTPDAFALEQNYPNPFNPTTAISFTVNHREFVKLRVFDLTGREVQTTDFGVLEAGKHTVGFDGSNFATGVYFYRLESPSISQTKKMLLLK